MGICFRLPVTMRPALLAGIFFLVPAFASVTAPAARSAPVLKLWQKKLRGYVSDVAVAGNGQAILVATLPNYDDSSGARHSYLVSYDRRGRRRWRRRMTSGVKSLALSEDGTFGVVTTHDDRIRAFNSSGKNVWTVEGSCKPILLSHSRRIVCYHDEDAEPRVAFDLYSEDGLKLGSAPAEADIMALSVSEDEREIAVGLARGEVVIYSDRLKILWRARLRGEIVAIGFSRSAEPRLALLYSRDGSPRLAVLDSHGGAIADRALGFRGDRVDFLQRDPSRVLVYGNGDQGQTLALFEIASASFRRKWKVGEPVAGYYTQNLYGDAPGGALVGFEGERQGRRTGEIRAYGVDGRLRWVVPLPTSESAWLYTESFAPRSGVLAAASDDGTLGLYQIPPIPVGPVGPVAPGKRPRQ